MIEFLNEEQIKFVCKECGITREQLANGTEEELDEWYEKICFIECVIDDDGEDDPRVLMAESIVTALSDFSEEEEEE